MVPDISHRQNRKTPSLKKLTTLAYASSAPGLDAVYLYPRVVQYARQPASRCRFRTVTGMATAKKTANASKVSNPVAINTMTYRVLNRASGYSGLNKSARNRSRRPEAGGRGAGRPSRYNSLRAMRVFRWFASTAG